MANGKLGVAGEHDWLAVTLTANQAYNFSVAGLTQYSSIRVGTPGALDEGITALQTFTGAVGATATAENVWFTPDVSGTYYVDVSDPATIGAYSVSAAAVANDFTDNTTTTGVVNVGGSATTGQLGVAGEHDWLAVALTANQAYNFSVTGLTQYSSIRVGTAAALDEGITALQTFTGAVGAAVTAENVWFTPDLSGTYYVDVSDPATIGAYSVSAVTVANDFTDNTTTTGVVTVGAAARTGQLGVAGEHDWLAVTLTANQAYNFSVAGLTQYSSIRVGTAGALDEGVTASQTFTGAVGAKATPENVWFTPDVSGTYYVDVSDPATIGAYSVLAVTVANDFTDNTTTTGVVTVGASATTGQLGVAGEHDWLAVTLTANQAYNFSVSGLTQYGSIRVGSAGALDEGITALQTFTGAVGATATPANVWFTPDASGTYYVDVSDPATIGAYSVSAAAVANDFTDNITTTGVVPVGGSATTGKLGVAGEHDWLAVTLTANQAYNFSVTGLTQYSSIRVGTPGALDEGITALQTFTGAVGATATPENVWFTPDVSGTYYVDVSDPATIGAYSVSAVKVANDFTDNTTTTGVVTVECFLRGTSIAASEGEVPVERLRIGDLVHARSVGLTPVVWIGRRDIDARKYPRPQQVWPVRVTAGAFADNVPHRDLWLSPDHAVFVDNILVPIKHLINGTSIRQVPLDKFTYYHIELGQHDVLFAEGLPTESYLDTGNRSNFVNGGKPTMLHPDFSIGLEHADFSIGKWEALGCAPLIVHGRALSSVRRKLNSRGRLIAQSGRRGTASGGGRS